MRKNYYGEPKVTKLLVTMEKLFLSLTTLIRNLPLSIL